MSESPIPGHPPEGGATKTTRRALVVDDHEDSARALQGMLQTLGFETDVALDGIEGLRHAMAFEPDLLLLDIGMPKLDGYDTCGVLRVQPWARHARLVAVSGRDPEELKRRSAEAGFDAFLIKPVDFEDLRRITGVDE